MRTLAVVSVLALAMMLSGCSSGGGDSRNAGVELQGQGYKELKVSMDKGDSMTWSYSTAEGQGIHFDFHTHKDGGSQTIQESRDATGQGSFKAPEDGFYYLFWQNDGNQTVTLSYQMTTDGKVTAEYPQ